MDKIVWLFRSYIPALPGMFCWVYNYFHSVGKFKAESYLIMNRKPLLEL